MRPSCYSLQERPDGNVVLYLGEVTTAECLSAFHPLEVVALLEFGAEAEGNWLSVESMPAQATVESWSVRLRGDSLSLVDFTGRIGSIELSTHDDGEATFILASRREAIELLTQLVGAQVALGVAPYLEANVGCYISTRHGRLTSYPSFDEYLVGT
jgi:hypothetical protein